MNKQFTYRPENSLTRTVLVLIDRNDFKIALRVAQNASEKMLHNF